MTNMQTTRNSAISGIAWCRDSRAISNQQGSTRTSYGYDQFLQDKRYFYPEVAEPVIAARTYLNQFFGVPKPEHGSLELRIFDSRGSNLSTGYFNVPSKQHQLSELQFAVSVDDRVTVRRRLDVKIHNFKAVAETSHGRHLTVIIDAEIDGIIVPFSGTYNALAKLFKIEINPDMSVRVNTTTFQGSEWMPAYIGVVKSYFHWATLELSHRAIGGLRCWVNFSYDDISNVFKYLLARNQLIDPQSKRSGISKLWDSNFKPILTDLRARFPMEYALFNSIANYTGKTVNGVKCSTVFNSHFANVKTVDEIVAMMRAYYSEGNRLPSWGYQDDASDWYSSTPVFAELRKEALKKTTHRAFNKLMQDIEFLTIKPEDFPRTYKAITDGDLPLGAFFRKQEQYFLLNDNWELWEEMLEKHYDVACALGKAVAPRTTYEKDLMSYFYFVLRELPEYLEQHTGYKWTCIPKLVDSQDELEPPKEEANGITKRRSALTPIVDNEMHAVTVPYASLAIPGRQTTYCYSHDYHVLRRGMSFMGNAVMKDLEEKLNGRDDYGLMFYTLTGSMQGRGYPTFLIIFERRKSGTVVHFHRTHPSRSKDGDYNPVHNWTKVCYNWMIGNVPREAIVAQQGDLAFVKFEDGDKKSFTEIVKAYDSHIFDGVVTFASVSDKSKGNILGYIKVDEDNWLRHLEHEDVLVPAGVYEVRQCRSWEANPKGVWSLRID